MRTIIASTFLVIALPVLPEDPTRGVPFGATAETIKTAESALGSTIGLRNPYFPVENLTAEQRVSLESRMTKLGFFSFLGRGFGRDVRINYTTETSKWSQEVTFFPQNRAEMESIIGVVASALKNKYGNPSFSPDSVGFFNRAKIWFLENNRYLGETNHYRWALPDRNIILTVSSYPGQIPDEKRHANPRVHPPVQDMPWEVFYGMYGNPKER